jgi:predicted alpha/beta-fold hydrolase
MFRPIQMLFLFFYMVALFLVFVKDVFASLLATADASERPAISYRPTASNRHILSCMPSVLCYKPLRCAHTFLSQTVLVEFFYSYLGVGGRRPTWKREILTTDDDQRIVLDWVDDDDDDAPCVVIYVHGVGGTTGDSCYLRAWKFCGAFAAVSVNRRGSSDENRITRKARRMPTHADTEDLSLVFSHVRERFPTAIIVAVGYSAGGNHVVKAAAAAKNIDAVVSVSCNHDLAGCHDILTANSVFDSLLGMGPHDLCAKNIALPYVGSAKNAHTLTAVDACVAKQLRFPSVREYYAACGSLVEFAATEIPLLYLMSDDDPLLAGMTSFATKASVDNPNIIAVVTRRGGHVAWLRNDLTSWVPDVVAEYVNGVSTLARATRATLSP